MVSYRFTLIAVTGLLRAGSSLQATAPAPADMKCDPKRVVSSADCDKAWAKIKYEPDSTLFKDSGHIERISGNCVVIVVKTLQTIVNKQTVEDGFKKMIAQCKDSYVYYPLPGLQGAHLTIRPRAKVLPIEDDAAFNEPVCVDKPNAQKVEKADCMESYKALTTSSDGHFISASKAPTNVLVNSVKTCKVGVFTSDVSNITATKHDVDDIFGKMLDKCNGKWGGVPIEKGAAGPNGRLFLIAIPTKKP
ncbi:hypothetical protein Pst134EB_016896 [Puccinia striiformis f. sp. tritici]|nr:hypothetical protein Pst134EB_016896 [Puccinia striiformis f. sp. tritici]